MNPEPAATPAPATTSLDRHFSRLERVRRDLESVRPKLKAERIQEALLRFPSWQTDPAGPGLVRGYRFPTVRDAGAFAAFVTSVFSSVPFAPEMEIVGSLVAVRVATRKVPGEVTALDFDLIALLDGRED